MTDSPNGINGTSNSSIADGSKDVLKETAQGGRDTVNKDNRSSSNRWTRGRRGQRSGVERQLQRNQAPAQEEQLSMRQSSKFTSGKDSKYKPGEYGYTSRGEDNRLQRSKKERHEYFNQILSQFVTYCNENPLYSLKKEIEDYFNEQTTSDTSQSIIDSKTSTLETVKKISSNKVPTETVITLEGILASLRKLREALLHTKPDDFNKKVYFLSVEIATSIGHYQTYLPGIKYLLEDCADLLTSEETKELANLMVLHFLHFNNERQLALVYYFKYLQEENSYRTWEIIESWIQNDYVSWNKLYNSETHNSRSKLMSFGLSRMIRRMVDIVGKSYYTYNYDDMVSVLLPKGTAFEDLVSVYSVPWEKNGNSILVRKRN